jgi:putative sterol carrier protein
MASIFPSTQWLDELKEKLNNDEHYAQVAKNWEGDLFFFIEPEGNLKEQLTFYIDIWHGVCRKVEYEAAPAAYPNPVFTLRATYGNIASILSGKLHPMTAMLTNKLKVRGNMGYMMRNVPTVLDFVRCASENTTGFM